MVLYLETLAKELFKIIHFSSFFLKFFTMAIPKEVLEGMRHSQIFGYIFHQCLELGLDPIWRQSDHLQTFFSSNQILRIRKFDNDERVLLRPLCTFACILEIKIRTLMCNSAAFRIILAALCISFNVVFPVGGRNNSLLWKDKGPEDAGLESCRTTLAEELACQFWQMHVRACSCSNFKCGDRTHYKMFHLICPKCAI